jgi:hypothetical protein
MDRCAPRRGTARPFSPSVMIAAPTPFARSAPAARSASAMVRTSTPVIPSASLSFGVTKSQSASISGAISAAGAGFRIVRAPPARAISSPRWAASIGCSSWVTKTEAPPISSARASTSATRSARPRPAR